MSILNKKNLAYHFLLIILIIWAFFIRIIDLKKPWIGHHDFNGTWISIGAVNYLKYGYLHTKFGTTTNTGPITENGFSYYIHHPPLINWLVSLAFKVYGISESSARIVSIFLSLSSIFLIFKICLTLFDQQVAILAATIQAFLPMDAFFGRFVNHEPLIMFFALMTLYLYIKWLEGEKKIAWLVISTILGCLSGWSFYYIPFLLFLHFLIFEKKLKKKLEILILPSVPIISFLAFLLYIYILTGSFNGGEFGSLFEAFNVRISRTTVVRFSFIEFLTTEYYRILKLFNALTSLVASFYLLTFFTIPKKRIESKGEYLLLLLAFGLLHPIIFEQQAFIHDYLLYNLSPFISISSALVIKEFSQILKTNFRIPLIAFPVVSIFAFMVTSQTTFIELHMIRNLEDEYYVGSYLRNNSNPDQSIITSIEDGSKILQLKYYSQRHVEPNIRSKFKLGELLKDEKINYQFYLDNIDVKKSEILEKYLEDNYEHKNIYGYVLYNFKKPIDNK